MEPYALGDLGERRVPVAVIRDYVDQHPRLPPSTATYPRLDSTRGALGAPPHQPLIGRTSPA